MKARIDPPIIYAAALVVFARYGFKKATVADIADRLDMSTGNLYRYAKNKRDLYEKTVSWALTRWQDKVRRAVADQTNPIDQFETLCRSALTYLSTDSDLRRVLAADPDIFPLFVVNDPYAAINQASVDLIRGILRQGIRRRCFRAVDVDATAATLFDIYKLLVIRTYLRDDMPQAEAHFEQVLTLITHGLLTGQPSGP